MKFVDLSQNPPVTVELLELRNVAYKVADKIDESYNSTRVLHLFQNWRDNPAVDTPDPDYTIEGADYWNPQSVDVWKALYDTEIEKEDQRKLEMLSSKALSLNEIVNGLIDYIEVVERKNRSSYSHNRGNSLRDARLRILKAEGAIEIVNRLLGDVPMSSEQKERLGKIFDTAKNHVGVQ